MDFLITDPSEKVPLEKKKHIVKDRSNVIDQISNFLGKQKHFEQIKTNCNLTDYDRL